MVRAAPVLVLNLVLPMVLDHATESLLITPIAGMFSLAAFKVCACCANGGGVAQDMMGGSVTGDPGRGRKGPRGGTQIETQA